MTSPASLILSGLEAALNQILRLDPDVTAGLAELNGKVIGVELRGLNLRFSLIPEPWGLRVAPGHARKVDVMVCATPAALGRLARGAKAVNEEIDIQGDMDLGRTFQGLLRSIDIDWEEQLSRITGDVVAHQFGRSLRRFLAWGQKAADTLAMNASEYLQQESRDLPPRLVVEQFMDAVDTLRADTDRLEARIGRLQRGKNSRHSNP
jgi:ubiquinone biosynthesis protein UbiJ